jgi:hypothetical protein
MTTEAWQTVKSLFFEAATMEYSQREVFLQGLEQADAEISELVRELLAHPSDEGLNLGQPCWLPASDTSAEAHALTVGQRLLDRFARQRASPLPSSDYRSGKLSKKGTSWVS